MGIGQPIVDQSSASGSGNANSTHRTVVWQSGTFDDEIPSIFVDDALFRLRNLSSDEERFKELENYGHLKDFLADKLWEGEVSSSDARSKARIRPEGKPEGESTDQASCSSAASCSVTPSLKGRASKQKAYDYATENVEGWHKEDPRLCRKGHSQQVILCFKNSQMSLSSRLRNRE